MMVGILVITHDGVGQALFNTAMNALGRCPVMFRIISVLRHVGPEQYLALAQDYVRALDNGSGVLVLTDMYGSTPSNIACELRHEFCVAVVAGINLPMLIRVLNYPELGLDQLIDKAVSGGKEGILNCTQCN